MQNGFRKTTPMNMNENCIPKVFVHDQIHVTNETILLANERLEVSLQKLLNMNEYWPVSKVFERKHFTYQRGVRSFTSKNPQM